MKIKNMIYLWVGLLAAFTGNALGFEVTPTNPTGSEGQAISLSFSIVASDWVYDEGSSVCDIYQYQFVIDMQQVSGNATWSDSTASGDFHLDYQSSAVPKNNQIVFCAFEAPSVSTYTGYSLNLHEDNVLEGAETAQIQFMGQCNNPSAVAGGATIPCPSNVNLTIYDNTEVTATITATIPDAREPDVNGEFTITIDKPAGPNGITVYYDLDPGSTAVPGVDFEEFPPNGVDIGPGQRRATLPVVVIDNNLVDGDRTVIVKLIAETTTVGTPGSATVTIRDDDDKPTVSVAATNGAEPSTNGNFRFTSSKPAPRGGTTVNFAVSSASTATRSEDYEPLPTSATIAAGRSFVDVPVVVIDDDIAEGPETVIVELQSGTDYEVGSRDTATVTIEDDDNVGLLVSATTLTTREDGTADQFSVSLTSQPGADVTVNVTSSNPAEGIVEPASILFNSNNWSSPQVVTVTGVDDDVVDGDVKYTVTLTASSSDSNYASLAPVEITATNYDDDHSGLLVSTTTLTTREDGTADQFNVSLASQPDADVTVNITSSNPSEGIVEPASILFNSNNWSSPQVVTVTGVDDDIVDGDIEYTVTLTTSSSDSNYASLAPVVIMATNYDNDGAPPIAFSQDTFSVKEEVGVAEISIERIGGSDSSNQATERVSASSNQPKLARAAGSSDKMMLERPAAFGGELTVTFSTDDNNSGTTATAGVDYTPVNEVLVWSAGDYAPKTVSVDILSGAALQGDETVVLKLDVSGFNSPAYADLVISNDFIEDVIASINLDDLPLNQQSIIRVILASCPQGSGQGGYQELCTDLLTEAFEGGSVRNPLQQVTPEQAAAARTPAIQTQTVQNINVNGRQSALRGGATGLSTQGFSVNLAGFNMNTGMFRNFGSGYDSIQANATNPFSNNYMSNSLVPNKVNASGDDENDFGNWGIWVSGKAIFGDKNATDREQGFDFDTAGLTVGVDYRFTDKLVAGAAFGYANNSIRLDRKSGKLDTSGLTGTIYGSYYPTASFYMDASFSFGKNDYKQNRKVVYQLNQIGASVDQELKADYDGDQTGATFGSGYDFHKNGWVFGPTLFVEYIDITVDAYDERLLSSSTPGFTLGWATHINKQKYESLIPQIGVQLSKAFSQSWGVIVPTARVSWAKELRADNGIVSGYFLGDTSQTNFNLLTDSMDEDFFKAGVGLSAMFQNNKSAFLSVDGDFGRDLLSVYYINAGFRWEF